MTPDDPRHGQNRGYVAGCRDSCCRQAHMVEMKRYRLTGKRKVPAFGAQRRVQALVAIGWPTAQLCEHLGRDRNYLLKVFRVDQIQATTHRTVAALYEELSMTVPADEPGVTNSAHKRARLWAQRNGWHKPLDWNDIDDPTEDPAATFAADLELKRWTNWWASRGFTDVDEVRVLRILSGDMTLAREATNAERREVVARWTGPLADLERRAGWKPERYADRDGTAA